MRDDTPVPDRRPDVPSPIPEFTPPGWHPAPPPPRHPPVPVVPLVPGDRPQDVFARLLERRIVFVTGMLNQPSMSHAAAQLMFLDASGDDPIELRLMCPDADLDAALALSDTIDALGVEVRACATGTLGGAALAPFAAGGRRTALRHATFVLRDPRVCMAGRAVDLTTQVAHHDRQVAALHAHLASSCGQSVERIAEDMRNGLALGAEEALDYGLVHRLER